MGKGGAGREDTGVWESTSELESPNGMGLVGSVVADSLPPRAVR